MFSICIFHIGFTITRGKIVEIELLADHAHLVSSTWRSSTTDEPTSGRSS